MLARIGHALLLRPNYPALRLWNSSNRSAHEAEHGQKRCLATANPARPKESLNLGRNGFACSPRTNRVRLKWTASMCGTNYDDYVNQNVRSRLHNEFCSWNSAEAGPIGRHLINTGRQSDCIFSGFVAPNLSRTFP